MQCKNALQLASIKDTVLNYHKDKQQDSGELLAFYIEREAELNPEKETFGEDILNIHHKKLAV